MTPEDVAHQKEVEYYASNVDAWFSTALEHDKSVLALSAAGIGLLVTLLTAVGISSAMSLALYMAAIACFLVALVTVLFVYRRNRTYIERIVQEKAETTDPALSTADTVLSVAFALGVIFTAIIGAGAAIDSYVAKEITVAKEPSKSSQPVPLSESFSGATNVRPSTSVTKSFNGAPKLVPQTSAAPSAATDVAPAPVPQPASAPAAVPAPPVPRK